MVDFPATVSSILPTVSSDITTGVVRGSLWVYTGSSPRRIYVCHDNASGAAIWTLAGGLSSDILFGTGVDGSVQFSTGGVAPSGSVAGATSDRFTLTRDVEYANCILDATTFIDTAGYELFISGTLSGSGTICDRGNDAVTTTAGAVRTTANSGSTGAGMLVGGAGRVNNGNGNAGGNATTYPVGGAGGPGGAAIVSLAGGAGSATKIADLGSVVTLQCALRKHRSWDGATQRSPDGGGGGGGGGCDGAGSSGAGGSSGGLVCVWARLVTFTGIIHADGGNGSAAGGGVAAGGGGGGGGGKACLITQTTSAPCTVRAAGGALGAGSNGGASGSNGSAGTAVSFVV